MEASFKTNMENFRKKVQEYGKRIDRSVETAATDLSFRAENAVKREFTRFLRQTPSEGGAGKTNRTAHLRSEVHAVVKNRSLFGLGSSLPHAGPHERGTGPYVIRPKRAKALRFIKDGKVIYAKQVLHPGQKARHWMSIPMREELTKYIDDQIDKLEKKPL